ncbi:MAG: glycosyltransferase [Gammaproteobacteria bacterium]|nr:glycosyltransferase [Gammaproteobacteria bacterium]
MQSNSEIIGCGTSSPQISVVMSVYNGEETLSGTIESILDQRGVDFEFIIVNDGSTDGAGEILNRYAALDRRVRLLSQVNKGLTEALVNGCAKARGRYIARQDVGDLSLPARLDKQLESLEEDSNVVATSCINRFVGPRGEFLYEGGLLEDPTLELMSTDVHTIRAPIGASAMFRKDDYQIVGGYRRHFRVAQDLDLWLRLVERGKCTIVPQVLYQCLVFPSSISGTLRDEQVRAARIAIECRSLRAAGKCETEALRRLEQLRDKPSFLRFKCANGSYYIGRCLQNSDPARANTYYRQALMYWPIYPKAWWHLFRNAVTRS